MAAILGGMRTVLVAVGLALVVAGGCATEKQRLKEEHEERISAARLEGKFRHDDPLVQMLSPNEREALDRAGMLAPARDGEIGPDGEEIAADDELDTESTSEKAGGVMLGVLSVVVPLGMAVAPYLLF